tara:strand:+ start:281 stop:679 length:399 start_codon:yes stop_codon:yes gene_type:complete
MTAFSYLYSFFTGHQFREPELLNQLLNSNALPIKATSNSWIGWFLHFLLGYVFAVLLYLTWNFLKIEPSWSIAVISGIVAGFIGVFSWQCLFSLSPDPPAIPLFNFYFQLIIAHIIFCLSIIVFEMLESHFL